MKKFYTYLLSFASLGCVNQVLADNSPSAQVPVTTPRAQASAASSFTPTQLAELEKVIGSYLTKNPDVIMASFQAGMAKQQEETIAKMEKAVADNKDKLFKNPADPISGNPQGTQSLVVFMDPYCGYCKKFHKELASLLKMNKNVKVIFKDLPIMGEGSTTAIQAMLAAKQQGKYDQLQDAIFSSDKHLDKKGLMKLASSLGIDTKKLEADMKSKEVQAEIDSTLALSKEIGINGTPTLIIGETKLKVSPGYLEADELNKQLQESIVASTSK